MKTKKLFNFKKILVILLFIGNFAYSQKATNELNLDSGSIYNIKLIGNSEFAGKFLKTDSNYVVFETEDQIRMNIPKETILSVKKTDMIEFPKMATYLEIDSGDVCTFKLLDDSEITGKVISKDPNFVLIETESKIEIKLPYKEISSINYLSSFPSLKSTFEISNPFPSIYLFGPSAINLPKGECIYQNKSIILNSIDVGITKNISIGTGFEFITTILALSGDEYIRPILFVKPKVGFKLSDNFHVAASAHIFIIPDLFDLGEVAEEENNFAGLIHGLATYGTNDKNITIGLGYSFAREKKSKYPAINVSAISKISKRTAFITENWLFSDPVGKELTFLQNPNKYYGYYSYGLRVYAKKMTFDFALINNSTIIKSFIIGLPNIDVIIKL